MSGFRSVLRDNILADYGHRRHEGIKQSIADKLAKSTGQSISQREVISNSQSHLLKFKDSIAE